MKTEEIVKNLTNEQQEKITKLDSLLRTKIFREKLKASPGEALRKEGFDIPEDATFVFTEDEVKVRKSNGKDNVFYINLKKYESCYVDTEEFKNVAGGNFLAMMGMMSVFSQVQGAITSAIPGIITAATD